jgi:serine/threonine-protein kinase
MPTDKICPMCGTTYGPDHVFCPQDSTALRGIEVPEGLTGSVIGNRYLILEVIGSGGMGQVYKAQDVRLQRLAAVKVLHAHLAGDAAAVARVMREAANGSRIRNPHVVDISDYGETDQGVPYLAMEFIPGESLRSLIEREGPLEPRRAGGLLRQIAGGLDAAHRLGIIHRDLKPDNLLIYRGEDDSELVKIVDFGISRAVQDERQQLTRTGFITGTCEFMSPEQVAGRTLDTRSDIYALGLVGFLMLTGSLPFAGATPELAMMARLQESPRRLDQAAPSIRWPQRLQDAMERVLALEPAGRFESASAFARAVQDSLEIRPEQITLARPARRPRWMVPAAVAASAFVVAMAVLAAVRIFDSSQPEESAERLGTIAVTGAPPAESLAVESPAAEPSAGQRPADTAGSRLAAADSLGWRETSPASPETTISRPEPRPHREAPSEPSPRLPPAAGVLDSYRDRLRPDLPPDSAGMMIAELERLLSRLRTRQDSVEADIYRAEAYALTGDQERACALLQSARPRANPLQRRKMELWVEQGLCESALWQSS